MSSLEAWNNFLQEGFEILGDDFEPLKDYGEVAPTFARLTNEVIPLLTLESDLYAFVNGPTLKEWREKYVEKEMLSAYVAFQKDSIDILESDAMIMKDERARYVRFIHGFVMDAIQEESVKFEDMLFEEQEVDVVGGSETSEYDVEQDESEKEDKVDKIFSKLTSLRAQMIDLGFNFQHVKAHLSIKFHLTHKWLDNIFMPHTKGKAHKTKLSIINELEGMIKNMDASHVNINVEIETLRRELKASYERYCDMYADISRATGINEGYVAAICLDKSSRLMEKKQIVRDVLKDMIEDRKNAESTTTKKGEMGNKYDALQLEIMTLKNQLLDFYPTVYDVYDLLSRRFKHKIQSVAKYTAPTRMGMAMKIKRRLIQDMKTMLKEAQDKKEEVEPMKQQERINTFASNLAKAVIKQLDVNELNAEIADAFTVVTNLKTSLSVAEKQLNTVKTVKDMLSKGNLTEEDIVLLTQYVDSMAGN